ncbi:hypothetical protein M0R45_019305 [Rubus argutus]|uniref:Uncharacterized protein n=1 Tax=Rubus argutus TaxID=59490 RepID=A0AAW1X7J2_RUBAR
MGRRGEGLGVDGEMMVDREVCLVRLWVNGCLQEARVFLVVDLIAGEVVIWGRIDWEVRVRTGLGCGDGGCCEVVRELKVWVHGLVITVKARDLVF